MKARFLVLPLLLGAALFAQPGGGFGGNRTPPTPAEMVSRQVQMLTKFLGLDAGQQASATSILTSEQAQLQLNSDKLKADRAALVDAIKTNQMGSIDTLTSGIATLQGQNDSARAKAAAAIYALLTADQKTKLGTGLGPLFGGGPGFGGGRGFRPR